MRESKVQSAVSTHAASLGWYCEKIHKTGRRGFPDYLFIRDGKYIHVEFKAPDEVPTRQQLCRHRELKLAGATVLVIDSIELGKRIFDEIESVGRL